MRFYAADSELITLNSISVSSEFPTTPGAYDRTHHGGQWGDVFIAKLNNAGAALVYSTLFGGRGFPRPDWMPVIEFPWRIMFGTLATLAVGLCFKTPVHKRADMV